MSAAQTFGPSPQQPTAVYDPVEYSITVPPAAAGEDPFAAGVFTAVVTGPDGRATMVNGFCDAADGTAYKVRVMPTAVGVGSVSLKFQRGDAKPALATLPLVGKDEKRKGLLRVDPKHPYHFLWAGTGEHLFWNGTTAYWLLGVQDDAEIRRGIDRLASLKVNRIRVAINARTKGGERWYEPQVTNSAKFRFRVDPWVAMNPDDYANPKFDTSRYNVALWQKLDRLVQHARSKDMLVSVIFHLDGQDPGVDPFGGGKKYPGGAAEWNYYRYAAARLSAYSNVMWDVTNEWHLFRDEAWVNKAATVLREADPYKHLMSVHGKGTFPFRKEAWADFALFQSWDEGGAYGFMLKNRNEQAATGRPIPQVNEEYGYEDHYPGPWGGGRKAPARNADSRRRLAWEMAMAGGYQTTGERANVPGQGGWLTGLGDDSMTMLNGYAHMVGFFTGFDWWALDPRPKAGDALVLADTEYKTVAAYFPKGGSATLPIPADAAVTVTWVNPRTGERTAAKQTGGKLTAPDTDDWAAVVRR